MSVLPPSTHDCLGVPLLDSRLYTRRYTPRCSLAEHAINQMVSLQLNAHAIVKAMDYPRQHTIAASDRLRYVLCSRNMGLDGSYIDAYYDAKGFLEKLCELLQIEPEYYRVEMAIIEQTL